MAEAKPEPREGITGPPRDETNLEQGKSPDPDVNDSSEEREPAAGGDDDDGTEVGESPEHAEEQSDGHDDMERSTGQS